ncbi:MULTISPECIES: hypothetical protein [unclassified Mesorhizobium]
MVDAAYRRSEEGAIASIQKSVKNATIVGVVRTIPGIGGLKVPDNLPD